MAKRGARKEIGSSDCCAGGACGSACACRSALAMDGCRVEAVVSLDARGQMVLPKEVRERAGFRADERLAVISWERAGNVCCVTLQRADDLAEVVRRTYGPVLRNAGAD